MITRAPTFRRLLFPLIFSLVCVVLAIGILRSFGSSMPFEATPYRVSFQVPEADSVLPNSDVRTAGVKIGRVQRVDSRGRHAQVVVEIDPEHVPVRRDARVVVRNKSLLGEGYVELAPGRPDAAALPEGGRIPRSGVRRAERLDDVLQAFAPRTREDLRRMTQGMAKAFDGRAEDANAVLGRLEPATADLGTVVDALDDQGRTLQRIVADGAETLGALGRRGVALEQAIDGGARMVAATARRERDLRRTLVALPPFLRDVRVATAELGAASGDIRAAVRSLRPTVRSLVPAADALADDTAGFGRAFRRAMPALRTARTALPVLERALDAVDGRLPPLHMAARQLTPFLALASADAESILANFANIPAAYGGRTIFPGGVEGGHLSAWLTAWNEIVGGWTKKLPTHRSNPYPKPGRMDDFAKGGLRSYDCRNVNNPLVLPPFGAAPPCRLEGPYEFMGKKAYYPRLELPAP
ncbi:MAG: MlaD family protein [Solirubrobacteraceae bacterium]|nr:MlaD family protein [Solirubrobacteraceae bacterium]